MWGQDCHGTVAWDELETDPELRHCPLCKTRNNSWELLLPSGVLLWISKSLFENATYDFFGYLGKAARSERDDSSDSRLSKLFPFLNSADVFVGQRYHWVTNQSESLLDSMTGHPVLFKYLGVLRESLPESGVTEARLRKAQQRLLDTPGVGSRTSYLNSMSTNELFAVLNFVVANNTELAGESPKRVDPISGDGPDFTRNLVSVGGPIPNMYTRNLLYGDHGIPYKYDLNPGPDGGLADYAPEELRRVGVSDDSVVENRKPNWNIVDEDGKQAHVDGAKARPTSADSHWCEDFFMILKTENVYPGAENKQALSVSGCHGVGSEAALKSLCIPEIRETIYQTVGGDHFQALGRVINEDPTTPVQPDDIVLNQADIHRLR